MGRRSPLGGSQKTLSILIYVYEMENMRMPELKALMRESGLRGYSQLRKAELIDFLHNNEDQAKRQQRPPLPPPQMSTWEPNRPPQMSTWEPNRPPLISTWEPECEWENEARQPELEAPLTKRQLKHRKNKDSKLAKNSRAWMQRSAI